MATKDPTSRMIYICSMWAMFIIVMVALIAQLAREPDHLSKPDRPNPAVTTE